MDFSLTTIFVKPVDVALGTGTTSALTPGQIGLFNKGFQTPATGASLEFVVAQGRKPNEVPQTTKKSDLIRRSNILRYSRSRAVTSASVKIVDVRGFTAKCGEEVTLTLRVFSKYLNVSYANGLTKSFTIQTPCCGCGADPCVEVAVGELVDQFVGLINDSVLGDYLTAAKVADGDSFKITLTAKELEQDPVSSSLDNFVYDGYDVVDFYAYAYKGPATTDDAIVDSCCDVFATVETVATPTHIIGSYPEIIQLEKRYYSYQTGVFKDVNCDPDSNPVYASNAVPGTFYDQFLITFRPVRTTNTWEDAVDLDETVLIYVAVDEADDFATALNAVVGAASIETEY